MSSGNLVPDSILNPIVTEKLLSNECKKVRCVLRSQLTDFLENHH